MKKIKFLTTLIIALITFSVSAQKEIDRYTIQVDGLGCPFCAYGLEKKFKEFKGIKNVSIEIETGIFSFTYPSEKALSLERVKEQVKAAGYTPVSAKIERSNGEIEEDGAIESNLKAAIETSTSTVEVSGVCDMCKARIEKTALEANGVYEAQWNKENKLLTLTFDPTQINTKKIEKRLAKNGHDTRNFKASDKTYKNLPPCCHYRQNEN